MADEVKVVKHYLVPEHVKLSEEQKKELLDKLKVSVKQLPRIKISDPALKTINVKVNDLILIKRKSDITKESDYYRVVVND
ncbi:DNA-directed RNA polymerase subunit H [Candidatus Woesearchaeota archaeon]|nr:DNA-directed RNA polymerase subunit H [Candidatus Woesearchaeota archaeon]